MAPAPPAPPTRRRRRAARHRCTGPARDRRATALPPAWTKKSGPARGPPGAAARPFGRAVRGAPPCPRASSPARPPSAPPPPPSAPAAPRAARRSARSAAAPAASRPPARRSHRGCPAPRCGTTRGSTRPGPARSRCAMAPPERPSAPSSGRKIGDGGKGLGAARGGSRVGGLESSTARGRSCTSAAAPGGAAPRPGSAPSPPGLPRATPRRAAPAGSSAVRSRSAGVAITGCDVRAGCCRASEPRIVPGPTSISARSSGRSSERQRVGEAHRVPQVADPVRGVRRLALAQPSAR